MEMSVVVSLVVLVRFVSWNNFKIAINLYQGIGSQSNK